jgi:hypothetical protein
VGDEDPRVGWLVELAVDCSVVFLFFVCLPKQIAPVRPRACERPQNVGRVSAKGRKTSDVCLCSLCSGVCVSQPNSGRSAVNSHISLGRSVVPWRIHQISCEDHKIQVAVEPRQPDEQNEVSLYFHAQ